MLLYYITDRKQFPGDETAQRQALLGRIAEAARCGVDFIQLREKDLSVCELEDLAREAVAIVREASRQEQKSRLLINSRTDVAIAGGADGVHLRSQDISPAEVRKIYRTTQPVVSGSCHTPSEVLQAEEGGADFVVFGPVFGKSGACAVGLDLLADACLQKIPVLALGGVTLANFEACLTVGAAGVAGIRLFQQDDLYHTVTRLRKSH